MNFGLNDTDKQEMGVTFSTEIPIRESFDYSHMGYCEYECGPEGDLMIRHNEGCSIFDDDAHN